MPGHEPRQVRSEEAQKTEPVFRAASEPSTTSARRHWFGLGDDVRGYEPPELLSRLHRAASVPGRLAALVARRRHLSRSLGCPRPACRDPCLHGLSPAGAGVATGRDVPGAGAPSFYFLEERPPTADWQQAATAMRTAAEGDAHPAFHVEAVRRDFPIL